jgi:hypothetical protein
LNDMRDECSLQLGIVPGLGIVLGLVVVLGDVDRQPPLEMASEEELPLRIGGTRNARRQLWLNGTSAAGGDGAPLRLPMTQTTALQSRI